MKKYIIFILFIIVFPCSVKANSINSINMDVYIDDNGNAKITEVWDAYLDSGSEGFHSYGNIGEAYISDLKVSMDGREFKMVDSWNVGADFDTKEYSAYVGSALVGEYGIYFGISKYGNNKYIISYTINNFIVKLKDANMLYWNLVPRDMGSTINRVDITVSSSNVYSDSLDVWGYGKYNALAYVADGKIHMSADNLYEDEYMTLLVKYPVDMFNASVSINKKFDYYLDLANKGTVNYNEKPGLLEKIIGYVFFFMLIAPIILIYFIIRKVKSVSSRTGLKSYHTQGSGSYQNKRLDFGDVGNVIGSDILPYRDIPTEDILRAYWIVYNYDLGSKDEDVLGAFLLKWVRDGYIKLEKEDSKSIIGKKEVVNVLFVNKPNNISDMEMKLYNYFYQASMGDINNIQIDKKLSSFEFLDWCKNNFTKILWWFNDALDYEVKELVKEKKVSTERIGGTTNYDLKYNVDSSMMDDAVKVAGLKKFLEEFSVINQREPIEVHLFDYYLIYAAMFGIADKVYDKFKELYPDLIEKVSLDYFDVNYIMDVINDGSKEVSNARSYEEAKADDYTAGGGGYSSGGGGSDSFGSDSSGGFR